MMTLALLLNYFLSFGQQVKFSIVVDFISVDHAK